MIISELLVNSSRSIIYASNDEKLFADKAAREAIKASRKQMKDNYFLKKNNFSMKSLLLTQYLIFYLSLVSSF